MEGLACRTAVSDCEWLVSGSRGFSLSFGALEEGSRRANWSAGCFWDACSESLDTQNACSRFCKLNRLHQSFADM
jgi:hypothetical protein